MAELNDKEKRKFDVIKKVFIGEITKEQAQKELNLGIRQINRLLIKFKNDGEIGFIHKNRGKPSNKKVSDEIKDEIINLYITEYFDYNFSNRSTKQRIQLITKKSPETHQISSDFLFIPIPFPYTLHQNFLHHQATHQTKAKIFQGSLLSVCHPAEANYLANNSNTYKYSNYSI